jgi:two-component system, NtrC family, response regulator AtoC
MPEQIQIRALLAVSTQPASSALSAYFRARGGSVETIAAAPAEGPALMQVVEERVLAARPDLLVLEVDRNTDELALIRGAFPDLPVVVASAISAAIAFQAARMGATEILTLPFGDEVELASTLDRVTAEIRSRPKVEILVPGAADPVVSHYAGAQEFPNLFSGSPRMAEIRETIEKVANTSATVLVRGESGVGKEIVARMIFARSERSRKPFIKVNCAAIPNDLLESELFGFEAGAFTGAQRAKPGKFELANGGTLFLDEIAEMHPILQAKLLHVLQDGEFARLGAKHDTAVDVRVLCATNKMLEQRVAEGLFREDLFYRINVVTVHIPPLRERRDEIPILLRYFVDKYSVVYRRHVAQLDEATVKFLTAYSWPGNIRELENLCKRYVIVGGATQIVRELSAHSSERRSSLREELVAALPAPSPTEEVLHHPPSLLEIGRKAAWLAEKQAIREMLAETRWNRKEAARRLQVSYKALLNKIRQIENEDPAQKGHFGA